MEDNNFTLGDTVENKYVLSCIGTCKGHTKHVVICSVQKFGRVEETDLDWFIDYEIIMCLGCETFSFRKENYDTDNLDPYTLNYMKTHVHYPRRRGAQAELELSFFNRFELPSNLLNIYHETNVALDNQLRVLAGVGMRTILETVCKDKNAKGKNLAEKIDGLVSNKILTEDGAKILHQVRLLGNESAHEVQPKSKEQLDLAWEVIVNLLQNIYVLPGNVDRVLKTGK